MKIKKFNESISPPYKDFVICQSELSDNFLTYEILKINDNKNEITVILRLELTENNELIIKNKENQFTVDYDDIDSQCDYQADTLKESVEIMRMLINANKYNL